MSDRSSGKSLGTVLVADDHGVTRFGLMEFLRSQLGARVALEAARFGDAMKHLNNQKIDMAIFDLGIPGLKSPKDLRQVREKWPEMKVVVLSGSSRRANILAALEAGVHGYIVKTETMPDLAERLGYVLAGEIYVPACLADIDSDGAHADDDTPETDSAAKAPKLTARQVQVLRAIMKGLPNKQIAKELKLSVGTVKMHVSAVLTALGAQNRLHAAALARKLFD